MKHATQRWLRGAVVALVQVAALQSAALRAQENGPPVLPPAVQREVYEQATSEFRAQRYAAAYGRFARLADSGHVPSACIALLMVRDGQVLFRNQWYATPDQLRRWSALTVQAARQPLVMRDGDA
ncbi:MAG: hypothetical protein AD742_18730 [Methylibium sp. NZG]|nr:MAG: hypothetical protein AD742_18730 [Methylibium sp. NZG]